MLTISRSLYWKTVMLPQHLFHGNGCVWPLPEAQLGLLGELIASKYFLGAVWCRFPQSTDACILGKKGDLQR